MFIYLLHENIRALEKNVNFFKAGVYVPLDCSFFDTLTLYQTSYHYPAEDNYVPEFIDPVLGLFSRKLGL